MINSLCNIINTRRYKRTQENVCGRFKFVPTNARPPGWYVQSSNWLAYAARAVRPYCRQKKPNEKYKLKESRFAFLILLHINYHTHAHARTNTFVKYVRPSLQRAVLGGVSHHGERVREHQHTQVVVQRVPHQHAVLQQVGYLTLDLCERPRFAYCDIWSILHWQVVNTRKRKKLRDGRMTHFCVMCAKFERVLECVHALNSYQVQGLPRECHWSACDNRSPPQWAARTRHIRSCRRRSRATHAQANSPRLHHWKKNTTN